MVLSTCSVCSFSKRRRAQNERAADMKNAVFALSFVAPPSVMANLKASNSTLSATQGQYRHA
jgi:hypothetical protein